MRWTLVYRFYGRIPSVLSRTLAVRLGRRWSSFVPAGMRRELGTTSGRRMVVDAVFVTPQVIQRLNRLYRGINRPTDVLSFATDGTGELGDLVISGAIAAREAKRRGIELREELIRLLAHGTLHLLGLDHVTPREKKKMFGLQEKMVHKII